MVGFDQFGGDISVDFVHPSKTALAAVSLSAFYGLRMGCLAFNCTVLLVAFRLGEVLDDACLVLRILGDLIVGLPAARHSEDSIQIDSLSKISPPDTSPKNTVWSPAANVPQGEQIMCATTPANSGNPSGPMR